MQILLIDSDPVLLDTLRSDLQAAGFDVVATADPAAALAFATRNTPAFVLLNIALADGLTLDLLRTLRGGSTAVVIMLVGQGDEAARLRGLELGADDYVRKPVSVRELGARIQARLRHHGAAPLAATAPVLTVGPLTLDVAAHALWHAGEPLDLTPTELRLLHYLMTHAGEVVRFDTLLREVWGYEHEVASDVVRTTVYRLRRKLRDDPAQPQLLHTIAGVGFLLRAGPPPPVNGLLP